MAMLFITTLHVLLHADVFIMRLPLIGLENAQILGKTRKQHTITVLSVAENEDDPSSSSPSQPCRRRRRQRCCVFDVVPANATDMTTILRLVSGQAVPAIVRSRSMRLNLENATYVGRSPRGSSLAVERAKMFNARWPQSLSLFDDKTSCRHHTMLLVADIMQLEPMEVWNTYRLGAYLNF